MSKIWMLCIFLARSIFVDWESDSTTRLLIHSIEIYLYFAEAVIDNTRDSRWMSYEPAAILNQNHAYIPHIIG